jgi:hypothetical protein
MSEKNLKMFTTRRDQAMYLRMEGRTYKAIGEIMGVSSSRVAQLVYLYEWRCKQIARTSIPTTREVTELLPHIDSIKAIYEK